MPGCLVSVRLVAVDQRTTVQPGEGVAASHLRKPTKRSWGSEHPEVSGRQAELPKGKARFTGREPSPVHRGLTVEPRVQMRELSSPSDVHAMGVDARRVNKSFPTGRLHHFCPPGVTSLGSLKEGGEPA